MQIDYGANYSLKDISIDWEYPPPALGESYLYTVSVAQDLSDGGVDGETPGSLQLAIDETQNTSIEATQTNSFPPGMVGRYVRITVTGLPAAQNGMQAWASIWEVITTGWAIGP